VNTLVAGGVVFIGSHAGDASLARGPTVTVFCDLSLTKWDNFATASIIPTYAPETSGMMFIAPVAMCHALQRAIDNSGPYSHEESL